MKEDLMEWGKEAAGRGERACCGSAPSRTGDPEHPGYGLCSFVERFTDTSAGLVPVVKTRLNGEDHLGGFLVRCNVGRGGYKVAPGLYAVGEPLETSPVLVTANYKLSFDSLRKELGGSMRGFLWWTPGGSTCGVRRGKRVSLRQRPPA